ncbi:MAG TPA: hypothetical protein VGK58_23010 [Lacipirellulaceae bacterium]
MKFRFSLRAFLIGIALLAGALYWRVRPSIVAHQFAQAIADRDYTAADTWVRRQHNPVSSWRVDFESFASFSKDAQTLEMKVSWQKPNWRDCLAGRRRGQCVAVKTSDKYVYGYQFPLTATATSIDVADVSGAGGFRYQFSDKLEDWIQYYQN